MFPNSKVGHPRSAIIQRLAKGCWKPGLRNRLQESSSQNATVLFRNCVGSRNPRKEPTSPANSSETKETVVEIASQNRRRSSDEHGGNNTKNGAKFCEELDLSCWKGLRILPWSFSAALPNGVHRVEKERHRLQRFAVGQGGILETHCL